MPLLSSYGDCHQLPAVAMKSISDDSPASSPNSADHLGRLAIRDFLSPVDDGTKGIVIVMDQVIRQRCPLYLSVMEKMRTGTMDQEAANFIASRRLSMLPEAERRAFERDALYIMPRWKRTVPITIKYLKDLQKPVARVKAKYSFPRNRANHALKEVNLPSLSALAVGAMVMLLTNQIVEKKLMNGSIGKVVRIVYRNAEGPRDKNAQPAYVIVDFPDFIINESEKCFPDLPKTCIPIAPITLRCEAGCCSVTTIPLRVCKAITIHKSQGITAGPGRLWKKIVAALPGPNDRKTAGLELVALSRPTVKEALAIYDDEELSMEALLKIGRGAASEKRRAFEERLRELAQNSQEPIRARVIAADPNQTNPTFDGGFDKICRRFREANPLPPN